MLERIENTISRYNMIPAGTRLGVAVSGGADSIFLLHILRKMARAPLTVLHVDHRLRGGQSEGDAAFVQMLAARMKLPFIVHRMGAPAGNLEQFCRLERRAFFSRVMEEGIVDRVATGHTASDQAETVLMRLLRGAGTTGLRGVLPVTREGLIRPLLSVDRLEIRRWLEEAGVEWREDASNLSPQFLRNRIRNELVPVLRSLDARAEQALSRVAELASVDEEYWREAAGSALARIGRVREPGLVLDRREMEAMHPALRGRVVRAALEKTLGSLRRVDRSHVERVVELTLRARGEGEAEFPGGRAVRSMDWVLIQTGAGAPSGGGGEVTVPGEFTHSAYRLETWMEREGVYSGGEATTLDWEKLRQPLRLHTWKAGDRFDVPGGMRARLIKDIFENWRVPLWDRTSWPIIKDPQGIVWMHGMGSAARAAETTETRIRLRIRCDTVSSK